jgi:aminopeptidase N
MKYTLVLILVLFTFSYSSAQKTYNPSDNQDFDLIHTKLDLKPDWKSNYLYGKAELRLKPWFYPQEKLILDAKGFQVNEVKLNDESVSFEYDSVKLTIPLGRRFSSHEEIKISIDYIAKPDELTKIEAFKNSEFKGLYFVNSLKNKPQQIWSEGETEYNSCWFPTLDSPNQKHSQEISITVAKDFKTLSNGLLSASKINDDGTKTDTWVQDLPHSVYLSMIAAGPFEKVVDSTYSNFEVSYYVEPEFKDEAYHIFGRTPEMINYFEELLGTKYPWKKYAQIAVRDYMSGAMENTTATVHGSTIQKNRNQIIDNNDDGVIAHELFHHWFGDLVTAESWANLSLNEAFANYSEYLWATYKYGEDEGDWLNYIALNQYLNESDSKQEAVIRYNYDSKEDMFDSHSYEKGGRILHMLRNELGDKAFFAGLKFYLEENKFKNIEIHNLRMAMEAVSGRDLNWFFDQWFLKPGHARLRIEHTSVKDKIRINVIQQLDSINNQVYQLPLTIEFGTANGNFRKQFRIDKASNTFEFKWDAKPTYISADPDGNLLAVVDNIQLDDELYAQFASSKSMISRLKAFNKLTIEPEATTESQLDLNQMFDNKKRAMVMAALNDNSWKIREMAVHKFFNYDGKDFLKVEKILQSLIRVDQKSQVRSAAILAMKNFLNPQNDLLFRNALNDTSYTVRGAALEAILINQPADADSLAESFGGINDVNIFSAVAGYKASQANPKDFDWFTDKLSELSGTELYQTMGIFGSYIVTADTETQQKSIPFLKDIALNENSWFARFSAAQALILLLDLEPAKDALKEVFKREKEERLKNIYSQVPID